MKNTILSTCIALCALSMTASGALYEVDTFSYTTGTSLNTLNGGTGWSGNAWSDADQDVTVSSGSLAYPASSLLTSSGNKIGLTATDTSASAYRTLGTPMSLASDSQNYYSSALFSISAVTGQSSTVSFTDNSTGIGNIRWQYGINASGNFIVSVAPGSTQQATSTATASINTTYLLVARFRTNTGGGGTDQVFLKIFAPGDTVAEPASDGGWDLTASGGSTVLLRSAVLNMSNGAGETNQFDEFRVTTTFGEVAIPEPATLGLLLFGSASLLIRRRR